MPYYRQVKELHYLAMDFNEESVWVPNIGSEVFDARRESGCSNSFATERVFPPHKFPSNLNLAQVHSANQNPGCLQNKEVSWALEKNLRPGLEEGCNSSRSPASCHYQASIHPLEPLGFPPTAGDAATLPETPPQLPLAILSCAMSFLRKMNTSRA